jgi:hypothetical protein
MSGKPIELEEANMLIQQLVGHAFSAGEFDG